MNNDEKILKILEAMQVDIAGLKNGQDTLTSDVKSIKTSVSEISRISTILKLLPPRGEVEEIVDTAKKEINANILNLDAKVSRKLRSHDRRIENLENEARIENPDKN
jgi:hypothetical protein